MAWLKDNVVNLDPAIKLEVAIEFQVLSHKSNPMRYDAAQFCRLILTADISCQGTLFRDAFRASCIKLPWSAV